MNNPYGLTAENMLLTLPSYLRNDKDMVALAESVAETMSGLSGEIDSIRIYAMIDKLPEELLDILAYDFKVDWWDPNYTLEEKRQTFKDSWRVHRKLGTKFAVERAISAIYKDTFVAEWFQYGGMPFDFKLMIDATYEDADLEKHKRVIDRVEYYKNLRSTPYSIEYTAHPQGECIACVGVAAIAMALTMTVEVDVNELG